MIRDVAKMWRPSPQSLFRGALCLSFARLPTICSIIRNSFLAKSVSSSNKPALRL